MLLDKGADVKMQGEYCSNALQMTSYGGYNKVVQILLDKGANVNTVPYPIPAPDSTPSP